MSSIRRFIGWGSAAAVAVALLSSSHSLFAQKPVTHEHVVKILGMAFVPKVLHIRSGETVTWINNDIVPHGVKPKSDATKDGQSGLLQPHESWSHAIDRNTPYICPYHPTMEGEIVVDPPESS